MDSIELYLHIPFCLRKCAYCDFLSAPADDETMNRYVRVLQKEIAFKSQEYGRPLVSTIFFGGGTPSCLDAVHITDLMETIRHYFDVEEDAEISIEVNPGTVTKEGLARYKASGINRISVGLQSARNAELRMLGRIHTYESFLKTYDLIRKTNFQNVNVDLMSGLPGQTLESYKSTLKSVLPLRPEHISAYSLQIEENTPFYELYEADLQARERGEKPELLPTEEEDRAMYALTKDMLEQYGYQRYEISNYARKGKICRHNKGYWTGVSYLGLGLGASSYMNGIRYKNEENLANYLKNDRFPANMENIDSDDPPFEKKGIQIISRKDQMEEFMFLGLRLMEGVSRSEFLARFGTEVEAVYGDKLTKLSRAGVLVQEGGRIYLTDEGIDVSNLVLADFLL